MKAARCFPNYGYYFTKAFKLGVTGFNPKTQIQELDREIRADGGDSDSKAERAALKHPPKAPDACGTEDQAPVVQHTVAEDVALCAQNDVNACGRAAVHMESVECYPNLGFYYFKAYKLGDNNFSPRITIKELEKAIREAEDVDEWIDADTKNYKRNPNGPEARERKRPLQYKLTALRHPPKAPDDCGINAVSDEERRRGETERFRRINSRPDNQPVQQPSSYAPLR